MQCVNCQFENMPGVTACGRCGASLQLAALAISVYPPRASALAKRWRRWFGWMHFNWRRAAERPLEVAFGRDAQRPALPVIVRMVLPGWPQFYLGRRERGWLFLGTFLMMAIGALTSLGTMLGSLCLGLAVAAHAASVLDVVIAQTGQSRARHIYAIACLAGVGLAVYLPLSYVTSAWIVPRQMAMTVPPFFRGDGVLMSPGTYSLRAPRSGDVVLYEIPSGRVAGTYAGRGANYAIQGQRIDRVLATAGQHVRIEGGKLFVDGQTSPHLPLNPEHIPASLDVTVPSGHVLILPTTALPERAATARVDLSRLDWQHVSLVSVGQIAGRVYVRHWPWSRFRLF